MPLEINEIGIRMHVSDGAEKEQADGDSNLLSLNQNNKENFDPCSEDNNATREEIVDDCVRRVLKILKAQKAR